MRLCVDRVVLSTTMATTAPEGSTARAQTQVRLPQQNGRLSSQQAQGSDAAEEESPGPATRFTSNTKEPARSTASASSVSRLFKFNRAGTNLEHTPTEESPTSHRYVLRRPRALQVKYDGRLVEIGDAGAIDLETVQRSVERQQDERRESSASEEPERRSTDFIDTQRERLELFIDLLFVGVITNISEHYFTQAYSEGGSPGNAIGEFVLLFLPTWRIFSELQMFLSSYYMDDLLQRLLVLWVIILSLIWGNNAPYFLGQYNSAVTQAQSQFTISTYLVATGSLKIAEAFYSIWIPWIRRLMLVGWLITLPVIGLWIGIISTTNITQVILLIVVLAYDYSATIFLRSPLGDRLLGNSEHLRKATNPTHTRKRYEQFFTIALGEGVIILLRNSPLGEGLRRQIGAGIHAMLIYFFLHWLYFNGDQSKSKIHALHRRWYIASTWQTSHVALYGSMLLLSSGMLGLIEYVGVESEPPTSETSETSEAMALIWRRAEGATEAAVTTHDQMRVAAVTVCISLAVVLCMTLLIALASRPVDRAQTLVINNRLIRLAPRALAIVFCALIWLVDFPDPLELLGTLASVMAIVVLWEWHTSLEKDWKWVQTKQ